MQIKTKTLSPWLLKPTAMSFTVNDDYLFNPKFMVAVSDYISRLKLLKGFNSPTFDIFEYPYNQVFIDPPEVKKSIEKQEGGKLRRFGFEASYTSEDSTTIVKRFGDITTAPNCNPIHSKRLTEPITISRQMKVNEPRLEDDGQELVVPIIRGQAIAVIEAIIKINRRNKNQGAQESQILEMVKPIYPSITEYKVQKAIMKLYDYKKIYEVKRGCWVTT